MTSKQAFDIIVRYIPICFKDELETIEKDLDMLELLKSKLKIDCFGRVHLVCDELVEKDGILANYDEWKIKAWLLEKELEND